MTRGCDFIATVPFHPSGLTTLDQIKILGLIQARLRVNSSCCGMRAVWPSSPAKTAGLELSRLRANRESAACVI